MDQILNAVLLCLGAVLIIGFASGALSRSAVKGWFGEAQGALAKRLLLDKDIYTAIHDVTIQTANGTTQIDHVVVSRFGIFVIETKNMKGWIFGDAKSRQWTQSIYGRKYRIQNPLHQNYRHIKALSEFLQISDDKLHSVVMFWGDAKFKTPMPPNVRTSGYTSYIKSKQVQVFKDEEVKTIISSIESGRLPPGWATRTAHIESLQARHSSTTTCPRCSSPLVLRSGGKFYGCASYPSCRYTRNV